MPRGAERQRYIFAAKKMKPTEDRGCVYTRQPQGHAFEERL